MFRRLLHRHRHCYKTEVTSAFDTLQLPRRRVRVSVLVSVLFLWICSATPVFGSAADGSSPHSAASIAADSIIGTKQSPIPQGNNSHIPLNRPASLKHLSDEEVTRFGRILVQTPQGRIEPIDTYASELLRKLYHRDHYRQLDGTRWLLSLLYDPTRWTHEPLLRVSDKSLIKELRQGHKQQAHHNASGTPLNRYLALSELFTSHGDYILSDQIEAAYAKPVRLRNKRDKELIKLDEKVNILYNLLSGKMVAIFPSTPLSSPTAQSTHLSKQTDQESVRSELTRADRDNLQDSLNKSHSSANSTISREGSALSRLGWYSVGDELCGLPEADSLFITQTLPAYIAALNDSTHTATAYRLGLLKAIEHFQQKGAAGTLPTPAQINAELFYNHADIFRTAFRGYLLLGFLLLLVSLWRPPLQRCHVKACLLPRLLTVLIVLLFLWQSVGLGLRWYISGRAPWTNAYESMVYVGWITVLAGLIFARRSTLTLALATLMGGVILFVSNLNWLDPQITPLVPVLKSYWLMIHVSVITASYGFFGIGAITGLASLLAIIVGHPRRELRIIGELSLWIGLVLLAAGIFLGAIWANESWGRYWGWDPKETWALITLLVYAFITHSYHIPRLNNDFAFASLSLVAIATVLMTFFGVNYYLSGLHSYGGSGEVAMLPVVIGVVITSAVITWAGIRYRKRH